MQLHTHARERDVHAATHSREGEGCTCSYTLTPGRGMYMQLHTHARERDVHAATRSRQKRDVHADTHVRERDVHAATHVRERHVPSTTHSRQGQRRTCRYTLTPGRWMYMLLHTRARESVCRATRR